MKNLLRVEVEPLSDQRWAKIERSLLARVELKGDFERPAELRRRYGGPRIWLAAAAVVAALAVVVFAIRPLPEDATLDHPSRITTGPSASHLALPGLTLDVEPESAVVVGAETQQGILLVLDRGSIVCQVAPRPSEAPLIVQAGAARVRVVGTRFSVTRLGEIARVTVHEGAVEVTSAGQSLRVNAGEQWPAEVSEPPPITELDPAPSAEPAPQEGVVRVPSASAPSDSQPAVVAPLREQGAIRQQKAAPKESTTALERAAQQKATPRGRPFSTPSKPRESAEAAAASDADVAAGPAPRPSSQALFEQATMLERSDPARASQLYRKLESGSDSWARNALYARGRLEASRGNSGEARRLLELYLQRFPHGSNAEDARAVLRKLR